MGVLKLNETPVRTSRNFNINNIKLENIEVPEKIKDFKNVEIIGQTQDIKIKNYEESVNVTYGLGDFFTSQVSNKANQKIKLEVNSKKDKEMQINFDFDEKNDMLVDNIEITANENSKSTFIIKYETKENQKIYHNGIIKVIAKENSQVNIIIVNFINEVSNNFLSVENLLGKNAKINYTIVDFGGQNSITNYYADLRGELSKNNIDVIYLGKQNQLFDLNYIAELRGKKADVNIEVQGALKDNSKKHFKGTIDFKKGCKKAKGNENESCMLLSDRAKSLALPMLLCSEEEVEGNHSSSSGKIGEKELFYIMSRGFEQKDAIKLMVRAKFNKIISNIKNEDIKNKVLDEVERKLD